MADNFTAPGHSVRGTRGREVRLGHLLAAFGPLCVVNFICALDATSLSVALPVIAVDIHGTALEAFWCGTSFLLTSTVFQPTFASLSHIFGRKSLLIIALTFFTSGSITCAVAQNFTALLTGRSLQGVGSGGISALTYVIVTDIVTLQERGKWFGLISMTWAVGAVSGPLIGGALAQPSLWRWIFWLNIPICGIAYISIPIFLRLNRVRGTLRGKLARVDWVGSILFTTSLTSLLISITWGGIMFSWSDWKVILPLSIGFFGLIIFIVWSALIPSEPILRRSMFQSLSALASYFGTVVQGMILWSSLYYSPLYFEVAKGYSPLISGIAQFPYTFTVGPLAVVIGFAIAKSRTYRWAIWTGWLITTVGVSHIPLFKADTPTVIWASVSILTGVGLGILYPAMSFAVQASASDTDLPFAAALYSFFRSLGQMLGVAVGGVIFQNSLKNRLGTYPSLAPQATAIAKDASALVQVIRTLPNSPARSELVDSYVFGLRMMWFGMTALAGLAFAISLCFTKDFPLDRVLLTEQGFRHGSVERNLVGVQYHGEVPLNDFERGGNRRYSKPL